MKFKMSNNNGFSLIELMVVVAIIGILASVGIPKYQVFKAKAVQSEAKSTLASIYTLQQAYFNDNDEYAGTKMENLGFQPPSNAKYNYTIKGASDFEAKAVYKPTAKLASCGATGDTWTINQDKCLINPTQGLKGCSGVKAQDKCN